MLYLAQGPSHLTLYFHAFFLYSPPSLSNILVPSESLLLFLIVQMEPQAFLTFLFLFSILFIYPYFFLQNLLCFCLPNLPYHHCLNVLLRGTVSLLPFAEFPMMSFSWFKTYYDFLLPSVMNTNLFAYSITGWFYSAYLTLISWIDQMRFSYMSRKTGISSFSFNKT